MITCHEYNNGYNNPMYKAHKNHGENAVNKIPETEPRSTLKDNTLSTSEFYFVNVKRLLHEEIY